MHAEPNPVPTEAGGKFPTDFGGAGLGSGSSVAGGQPWGSLPSQSWEKPPAAALILRSWCPGHEADRAALVAVNLPCQIFAAAQAVNVVLQR